MKTVTITLYDPVEEIGKLKNDYGTQEGVAQFIGVSQGYLSRVVTRFHPPSDRVLEMLGLRRLEIYVKRDVEL
jgi:hypothetical protein